MTKELRLLEQIALKLLFFISEYKPRLIFIRAAIAMASFEHHTKMQLLQAGIKEIVDSGLDYVPPAFVRPPHQRPSSSTYLGGSSPEHHLHNIPIINISVLTLNSPDPQSRSHVLHQIAQACTHWGFFQVVGHGINEQVVEEMKAACQLFFDLPAEERNRMRSQNFEAPVSYHTSFNPSMESARDWKDVLYVRDLPGVSPNGFLLAPHVCRKVMQNYRMAVEGIANVLYRAIFESLGINRDHMEQVVPDIPRLIMAVNYYPRCPNPDLTFGVSQHSDISSLTILLQDDMPGLEIRKGDGWIPVIPVANSFVVNLGDQIEILSNGIYKSIEHRAITNAVKHRMTIACFFGPQEDATIGPLSCVVSESKPALYKEIKFRDYVKNFYANILLPNKGTLDFARMSDNI